MGCTGTPVLGNPNCLSCAVTTPIPGDVRYTVNGATRSVAQRFVASKKCISSIQLYTVSKYGADLLVEIRSDTSSSTGPVPLGSPGSSNGLIDSQLISSSVISSSGLFTITFNPPLQAPTTGVYYHLVFSSNGKCLTLGKHDGTLNTIDSAYNTSIYPVAGAAPNYWQDLLDVLIFGIYFQDYSCLPQCGGFTIS